MVRAGAATFLLDKREHEPGQQPSYFGEITVRWSAAEETVSPNVPSPQQDRTPMEIPDVVASEIDADVLSIIVLRGIELKSLDGTLVREPNVTVALGSLEAATGAASFTGQGPCNVVWNQEIRFLNYKDQITKTVEVLVSDQGHGISAGSFEIGGDEGFSVTPLTCQGKEILGHVLIKYRVFRHDPQTSWARHFREQAVETDKELSHEEQMTLRETQLQRESPRCADDEPLIDIAAEPMRNSPTWERSPSDGTEFEQSTPPRAAVEHEPFDEDARSGCTSEETNPCEPRACGSDRPSNPSEGTPEAVQHIAENENECHSAEQFESPDGASRLASVRPESPKFGSSTIASSPPETSAIIDEKRQHIEEQDPEPDKSSPPRPIFVFRARANPFGNVSLKIFTPREDNIEEPDRLEAKETAAEEENAVPVNGPKSESTLFGGEPTSWRTGASGTADDAFLKEVEARQLLVEELDVRLRNNQQYTKTKQTTIPQPWYPPGESKDETHIPKDRRESERRHLEAIHHLRMLSQITDPSRSSSIISKSMGIFSQNSRSQSSSNAL
jgi:hypothetical protein